MKPSLNIISMAALFAALVIPPVLADDNAAAFKKLDADGDGFISEYEALSHDQVADAFTDADENNDGQLDMTEFAALEINDD